MIRTSCNQVRWTKPHLHFVEEWRLCHLSRPTVRHPKRNPVHRRRKYMSIRSSYRSCSPTTIAATIQNARRAAMTNNIVKITTTIINIRTKMSTFHLDTAIPNRSLSDHHRLCSHRSLLVVSYWVSKQHDRLRVTCVEQWRWRRQKAGYRSRKSTCKSCGGQ